MKNIKINKYMKNKKTLALIGIGAFLIVNDLHNHSHFNKIEKKVDHITKHTVTHAWEETIQAQREVIDSLLLTQMDLGAKLDSCELVNTK
tara:strand:+ start:228 stop:497 length:270 start_codon:yes stop_codon:yes gene_type:complete